MAFVFDEKLVGTSGDDVAILEGGATRDFIIGKAGDDDLRGRQGDDFLLGGKGNDIVRGNRGEDILFGGNGDDTIRGGREADILAGDFGADRLVGDSGAEPGFADTFLFAARTAGFADKSGAAAIDTIVDFEAGIDIIQFEDYDAAATLTFTQDGTSVTISVDADGAGGAAAYDVATVLNATAADVQAASVFADFVV